MKTLIAIQDKMIAEMLASKPETGQWSKAFERGVEAIKQIGFTQEQAWAAARDAHDMALLADANSWYSSVQLDEMRRA